MNKSILCILLIIVLSCTFINRDFPDNSTLSAVIKNDTISIDAYAYIDYMPPVQSMNLHIQVKVVSDSDIDISSGNPLIYIIKTDGSFFYEHPVMNDFDNYSALFECDCDTLDTLRVILEFTYGNSMHRLREDSIIPDAVF